MGLYRSPAGAIEEIDDDRASSAVAGGYTPITSAQAGAPVEHEDRGVLGTINAGASSVLSGATLGLSDVALRGILNRGQMDRLVTEREANPITSLVGQAAGAILPAVVAPESLLGKAPAGVLSRATAPIIERGGASALLGGGVEGAAQNAGAYLSDVALGKRDLSAEGVAGALGGGFAFGVGGGAVAMGIEKGSIAARRMFAHVADGGERAANAAEQAWLTQYQSTVEAHDAAVDAAKAQLASARATRDQAGLARDRASAATADIRAIAPDLDAAHAHATGLDEKIAAIEAASHPQVKAGGIEDLERLITEHDAAKTELDDLLRSIDQPDIGGAPVVDRVPVGEFGEPGAGGIKSQESIARAAQAQAPETEPAQATRALRAQASSDDPMPPQRIEVVRVGRPSAGTMEVRAADGTVTPLAKGEASAWADAAMPPGFTSGPSLETHRPFSIETSLPRTHGDVADNAVYVVRPSQIAERGAMGNELHPGHIASLEALPAGKRLPPFEARITPDGRIWIEDGNHRLQRAVPGDDPVAIRIKAVGDAWEPQKGARDITDRLRRQPSEVMPVKRLDRHQAAAASSDLQSQLDPNIQSAISEYEPKAVRKKLSRRNCANGACDTVEPEFREMTDGLSRHRIDLTTDAGIAEAKRLYHMTDDQVASMVRFNNGRMKRLGVPPEDMFHQISVTPDGIAIDWTANQFNKLPVPYVFRLRPASEPVSDSLTGLLRGTQEKLAAGESINAIGAPARGEYAVAKAGKRQQWLERNAPMAKDEAVANSAIVDDIARVAPAITKYERKSAELVEALGDAAPPMAKEQAAEFRAAEDDADRKMMDRTTRAVDDGVERVGVDRRPSANPPAKQRLEAAKRDQMKANAAYQNARVGETEAKIGMRNATEARNAIPAPPTVAPTGAAAPTMFGNLATAVGVAGELGVPGIPNPDEIPVIGPLLGMYLKYRALKATVGRFVGRVSASGDSRAAALAARTKDRIATAIDRSLGLLASPKVRVAAVAASTAIGKRIFDDGEPDAGKNATPQQQAGVRIREIIAANTRPELISEMVRKEMHGVVDPDLIDAAEKHLIARFAHLASVIPNPPPDNEYAKRPWVPSLQATHELNQRLAVIHDPEHGLTARSPAAADTFRTAYPLLYELAKNRLIQRVGDMTEAMPRDERLRVGALFQLPIDISLDPSHIAIVRAPAKPDVPPPAPVGMSVDGISKMYSPTRI